METLPPPAGSRTIERALCLLDTFTVEAARWRTTELAEHCGLPVPTAHRILRVLERFGYLVRDPSTRAYSLGPSVASFARESPEARLRQVALPVLHALHHAAREQVSLAALSEPRDGGVEICVVGAEWPSARVRALPAGAAQKVLLAQLGPEERPVRMRRELAAIRRRGWAFSGAEAEPDGWALAVPVNGTGANLSCAVGITGRTARLDRERALRHLALLKQAARRLGDRLRQESVDDLAAAGGAA